MRIHWFGHACFLIITADGTRILTDPFNEEVGYPLPRTKADIVTISHQHFDHNAVSLVEGTPEIISNFGKHKVKNISITGLHTYHDRNYGVERGENFVYTIVADETVVCHLGDLGHRLSAAQIQEIGTVDVLLLPIGGTFTITAAEAAQIVRDIQPRYAIPMHYKTEYINFPITGLQEFTKHFAQPLHQMYLEFSAANEKESTQIVTLDLSPVL